MIWLKSFSGMCLINCAHIAKIQLDGYKVIANLPMHLGEAGGENYEEHALFKGDSYEEAEVIFARIQDMLSVEDY